MNSILLSAIITLIIMFLVFLAALVVTIVAQCFVYKKAGERPWKALIPFYAQYVQLRFSWKTKMFIPFLVINVLYGVLAVLNQYDFFGVNDVMTVIGYIVTIIVAICVFVFTFAMTVKLSWSFGHGIPWAIGLTFLPFVFYPITAWGKSEYVGADITKYDKLGF